MLDLLKDPFQGLAESLLGQVLPGSTGRKYPLLGRLGEGGQGWVFRATWDGGGDVVVKVLRPDAFTREALFRFQREAQVLQRLSQQALPNPHVVRFYDHAYFRVQVAATGRFWDLPFTVLEFVDGPTAEQALEGTRPHGLGIDRARQTLRHVVLGLEDVHASGIIHRDLKPSNILLARQGGREIAKVTDFGLAKLLDPGVTRTTHVAGATVGYAPPEQFEDGNPRVGRATDVFSLAAVFYELVTGWPAFPVEPNAHALMSVVRMLTEAPPRFARAAGQLPQALAVRPDVVAVIDAELARAFAPEPEDRHPTAAIFFEAVDRALAELGGKPSVPIKPSSGALLIRASSPPRGDRAHIPDQALPRVDGDVAFHGGPMSWRCITSPLKQGALDAICVSPKGDRASGLGADSLCYWSRGEWIRGDAPPGVNLGSMRAVAWLGERVLLAGASPMIVCVDPRESPLVWNINSAGIEFRAIAADASRIVLAGGRPTRDGPIGVVAQLTLDGSAATSTIMDVPGSGPLRAIVLVGGGVLACGDGGTLVSAGDYGEPLRVTRVRVPLTALHGAARDWALVVGAGGSAFRVSPTLEVTLEPIQTTRDLFALALARDGTAWCAGDAGRVLKRTSVGWIRVGAKGATTRVLALHAGYDALLAFCADGSVFEGRAQHGD
jgi:serine/threonine-protein kinase